MKPEPIVVDIFGTIKRTLLQVLLFAAYFFALIAFALSAPLLFTVGAWWLASRFDLAAEVAMAELFVAGPVACAVWMAILSHWPDWVARWKAQKAGVRIERTFDGYVRASAKGTGLMFGGMLVSLLAGLGFTYAAHCLSVIPDNKMLFLMALPFASFAPCWMLVLYRVVRDGSKKNEKNEEFDEAEWKRRCAATWQRGAATRARQFGDLENLEEGCRIVS